MLPFSLMGNITTFTNEMGKSIHLLESERSNPVVAQVIRQHMSHVRSKAECSIVTRTEEEFQEWITRHAPAKFPPTQKSDHLSESELYES